MHEQNSKIVSNFLLFIDKEEQLEWLFENFPNGKVVHNQEDCYYSLNRSHERDTCPYEFAKLLHEFFFLFRNEEYEIRSGDFTIKANSSGYAVTKIVCKNCINWKNNNIKVIELLHSDVTNIGTGICSIQLPFWAARKEHFDIYGAKECNYFKPKYQMIKSKRYFLNYYEMIAEKRSWL